jgi:hypothetical protein
MEILPSIKYVRRMQIIKCCKGLQSKGRKYSGNILVKMMIACTHYPER